jgi:DNA polymerase
VADAQARRIVGGWREANPEIVASWRELQDAAIEAVGRPGLVVSCMGGRVQYRSTGSFLFCRLPSGGVLSYPSPTVERKSKTIVTEDGDEVEINRWGVSYWGTKKGWRKLDLYGGAQCAHVVSGTARDILAAGMHRVEAAGYPLVLTVHDEGLSEVDQDFGSAEEYAEILARPEPWMAGLPIVAKGWEGPRYAH